MDFYIQGREWCSSVDIWSANLWTLTIRTTAADEVVLEEIGSVLASGIYSNGVVAVGFYVL